MSDAPTDRAAFLATLRAEINAGIPTSVTIDVPALLAAIRAEADDEAAMVLVKQTIDQIVAVYNDLEPDDAYVHMDPLAIRFSEAPHEG